MGYRLSVDVGGTFTDIVLFDDETRTIHTTKVPSTTYDQSVGLIDGIKKICAQVGIGYDQITYFIHGTTVATNALLERKGAKTALITTKGFKDVLEIGKQRRPSLYDFWAKRPKPPIPRHLIFEVPERVLFDGTVELPLNEEDAREVARKIKAENVESVAVCFLNSYQNGENELVMKKILREELPGIAIAISYETLPEIREYERTCTTAVNAYLMPKVQMYINNLVEKKDALGVKPDLHVMQSNGGIMSADVAANRSVHTVFSGPAGGVLGGIYISELIGDENVITMDMGGTSTDIVLIEKGKIRLTTDGEIGNFPIKVPMIEMHTIGTGGGSLAWIDLGGTLRLGPESCGAIPGPACYNQGGTKPSVTDANLLMGRLDSGAFLGGEKKLYPENAKVAVMNEVGSKIGMSDIECAQGIVHIANANMCGGVKVISTQKGYDLREFSLISFGGAGSLHAAKIARELGMKRVIVPPYPGNFSAIGAEMAEVRYDYVRTVVKKVCDMEPEQYNTVFAQMVQEAIGHLDKEGFDPEHIAMTGIADMRYAGQAWELSVPIPVQVESRKELENIIASFQEIHQRTYGYTMEENEVVFVNLRLSAIGVIPKLEFKAEEHLRNNAQEALKGTRTVYFDEGPLNTSIYQRELLCKGSELKGPAIIEEYASTIVVLPGDIARVDAYGNVIIEREQ